MRGSLKGCNYQEFLVKTPWRAASQSQNCTKSRTTPVDNDYTTYTPIADGYTPIGDGVSIKTAALKWKIAKLVLGLFLIIGGIVSVPVCHPFLGSEAFGLLIIPVAGLALIFK